MIYSCVLQAAYTAIQAFQERFPSAGEDAVRLKEEVYALLEERAQHAKQRQWRLMQKKRARGEAQARSHQGTAEAEASVLATVITVHGLFVRDIRLACTRLHVVNKDWCKYSQHTCCEHDVH